MSYRFADHAFDPTTGDLRRPDGSVERLRPQAAQVLSILLSADGGLVGRDELQASVWPDTVVEFDQGLNACIREIRRALGDDAGDPRFVETLPRRGYRFLPKTTVERPSASPEGRGSHGMSVPRPISLGPAARRWIAGLILVGIGTGAGLTLSGTLRSDRDPDADAGRMRLMVLPLSSPDPDPARDTVAAILTDRLIADLSRLAPDRLGVIARASALRYGGEARSVREIGDELDLDYLVEGSVLGGAEPSVEVRLVDPRDATQLWAGRWSLEGPGVSETADRIGAAIASAVDPGFADAHENLIVRRAGDARIHDVRARVDYLLQRHTMEDTRTALRMVQEARQEAPDHPALLEALAVIRHRFGEEESATAAARRALEARPTSSEAHVVLGRLAQGRYAWDAALEHLERAVRLDPGSSANRTSLAVLYNYLGHDAAAVREIEAALALDPVSATLVADAGVVFFWAERYGQAREHCRAAIELDPDARAARRCLIMVAHLTDRPEVGAGAARALLDYGGVEVADDDADDQILRRYWRWRLDETGTDGCGPVERARALLALGRHDEALEELRTISGESEGCFLTVGTDPMFGGMLRDPEVRARVQALGVEAVR